MKIKVTIDHDKCMRTGNCVYHAPGVFDQNDDGQSVVVDLHAQPEAKLRFAANSCPVGAISVIETKE